MPNGGGRNVVLLKKRPEQSGPSWAAGVQACRSGVPSYVRAGFWVSVNKHNRNKERIHMKKLLALLLVAAMSISMVACGGSASSSAASSEAGSEAASSEAASSDVKIGVCIYQFADNFMTLYRNDIKADLEALGYKEGTNFTIVDGANDQAKQTEQIDSFIAEGVDVLIVNLVQSTSASTIIEKAKAADIPVVFINREPTAEDLALYDKCCYVGADARQSGTFQGEIIAATENKGDFNGNGVVDYAMIMGDPENVDAQYRTEYSITALEEAGLKVNKLYEQRADWDQTKGQENAANVLSQFNDEVDVIFCNNDAMAMGALQAIEAAGRKVGENIYLVGVDALEEAVQAVADGRMTGTVLNDDVSQAQTAVDAAVRYLKGEANEKNYTIDYVKVTPENAANYIKPAEQGK